jgi:hypothetical protein
MHTAGSHADNNQRKELLLTAGFELTLFGRRHFVVAIMTRGHVGALMSALLRHRGYVGAILTIGALMTCARDFVGAILLTLFCRRAYDVRCFAGSPLDGQVEHYVETC